MGAYSANYLYIHAIASVIGIFVVCVLIDRMRVQFIEKPIFHWLERFDALKP